MFDILKFKIMGHQEDVPITTEIITAQPEKIQIQTVTKKQKRKPLKTTTTKESRVTSVYDLVTAMNEYKTNDKGDELPTYKMKHNECVEAVIEFLITNYVNELKILSV